MKLSDFSFELPDELIATHPLQQRDAARLLQLTQQGLCDRHIRDLPQLVQPGDLWVVNNTRVIPARLLGSKPSGGKVEILLLEPLAEADTWLAWGKANKPLHVGTEVCFAHGFSLQVLEKRERELVVRLIADDVSAAIQQFGHMPLPPYIRRPDTEADKQRYQTVFARHDGAVAAPTAGLHLTPELMQLMRDAGAEFAEVTLHVGPGTFQPVQVDDIKQHVMHEEAFIIEPDVADLLNRAKNEGRRIVAVGTTSLRCLESAVDGGSIRAGHGRSRLFIYPGYQFKVVNALLSNFHLPHSTLLLLISALAGPERIRAAYQHAIEQQYRFFSYGDAMFTEHMQDNWVTRNK